MNIVRVEVPQAARNVVSLLRSAEKETDDDRHFVACGLARDNLLAQKQSLVRWTTLWVNRNLARRCWVVFESEVWSTVDAMLEPSDERRRLWTLADESYGTTIASTARSDRPTMLSKNIGAVFAHLCGQPTFSDLADYGERIFEVSLGLTQDFMSSIEVIQAETS